MRPSRSLCRTGRRALSFSLSFSSSRFHPRILSLSPFLSFSHFRYLVPPLFPAHLLSFSPFRSFPLSRLHSPCTLSVSSRTRRPRRFSPLASPLIILVLARPPLSSRIAVPLSRLLFPPRYISNPSQLVWSLSNSHPLDSRASSHSSRSRPPPLSIICLYLYPLRNCSLFFSLLHIPSRFSFLLSSFSLSDAFFLRPTLFRSTFIYRLVSGMLDHTSCKRARVCGRSSFSRSLSRGSSFSLSPVCVCGSLRYAMREKKMGGCIVGACHHGV